MPYTKKVHNKLVAILTLATVLFVVSMGTTLWSIKSRSDAVNERLAAQHQTDQHICNQINELKASIVISIRRGDALIDQIKYYKTHPDEAAKAHAQNAAELQIFSKKCVPTTKVR